MRSLFGAIFIQLAKKADQQSVHLTSFYESYAELMYELKDKITRMIYVKGLIKTDKLVPFSKENLYLSSNKDVDGIISQILEENERQKLLPDFVHMSSDYTFCWTGLKISSSDSSKSEIYSNQPQSNTLQSNHYECEITGMDELGKVKSHIFLTSSVGNEKVEIHVPDRKNLVDIDNDFFFLDFVTTAANNTRIFRMKDA
jgi:hypothetical protein